VSHSTDLEERVPDVIRVGLIGDHDPAVTAHQAIPRALALAAESTGIAVAHEWVPTDEITTDERVAGYDALWCVPASPYRSTDGALRAIRFAREQGRPFLGTCGGFQHAVLEYARSVLGWTDAEHAETAPGAGLLVVTPLECALVEAQGAVRFRPASLLRAAYGTDEAVEGYRCRYGLNPAFRDALTAGPLRVAAEDGAGDVRAVELDGHPFFVATLFQPERAALAGEVPAIVTAFLRAASNGPRRPAH
jgi:CTP synthase (UTP-ammonia lyase)